MKRAIVLVLLVVVLAVGSSCKGSPVSPSTSREQPTARLSTAHFQLLADRVDSAALTGIADALEASYSRITSDLRVTNLPAIAVWIWQDSASYYNDMQATFGTSYSHEILRSEVDWGYLRPSNEISLLVPSNAGTASIAQNAVHEFAHVVMMAINPSIPHRPPWLWEAVAVYENGQFVDPTTLPFMRGGCPSLDSLDNDTEHNRGTQIYQVGFLLGEYIVQTWGQDGLVRLIQGTGDVETVFGMTWAAFESGWHAFVRDKYHVPA